MDAAVVIAAIAWWFLVMCASVGLLIWIWIQLAYYRWNKEDRMKSTIIQEVQDKIKDKLDDLDDEQYASDFEETEFNE